MLNSDFIQLTPKYNDLFAADVYTGLTTTPKSLPVKWVYNVTGSELFEQITQDIDLLSYPLRRNYSYTLRS